jgi:hypothetical protein
MKKLLIGVLLLGANSPGANASQQASKVDESIIGTHWVKYQPTSVEGTLTGCQLSYLAVYNDHVYRNSEITAVNGSIWLARVNNSFGLMLKIGLKSLAQTNSQFERPHFAFLKGSETDTSKSTVADSDSDGGYKLYAYTLGDKATLSVLSDILSGSKISISFNRSKGGFDVNVPIDTQVVDSEYTNYSRVKRKLSNQSIEGFGKCAQNLIGSMVSDTTK